MIKSMTAFSRSEKKLADGTLVNWEIRSVNHRYLDISLSLPEGLQAFENQFKEHIRQKVKRGKVDAKLVLTIKTDNKQDDIPVNKHKVKSLLSALHMLEAISKKPVPFSGMDILNWPGVLESPSIDYEKYLDDINQVLDSCLNGLVTTREDEGRRLQAMIDSRCKQVANWVESVKSRRGDVVLALRERVLNKLAELDVKADPNRLEQELVFQAQRLDVDEELDRLIAHIEEVAQVLKRDEPVGRRLDFLMQELHREANTLASKSNDAETTKAAVELKVLIEQMREQVMNIE